MASQESPRHEQDAMQSMLSECDELDLTRWLFADMNGNGKTKMIPGRQCRRFVSAGGREICSAVFCATCTSWEPDVPWVIENGYPDCAMMPDPSTLHSVGWSRTEKAKVGQVVCSTRWPDGSLVAFDPRNAALLQLRRLREEFGLELFSAFELEWRLFVPDGSGDFRWIENSVEPYSSGLLHKYEPLLYDIYRALGSAGICVEAMHTEFGRGQMEVTMQPKLGLRGPDEGFLYRDIVKQVASNRDFIVSFMSTPYSGESGNGLHFNHSLWRLNPDGSRSSNAFHDPDKPDCMSDTMRHWLAGLIEHSGAITALTSPTVNCYRRLHLPFTPDFADWELRSRNATYRVKAGKPDKAGGTYIESRLPSSAANAYLVAAATLAAGIDGLQRRLELPPPASRPKERRLPSTMEEALNALESDEIVKAALGERLVEFYSAIKRQFDIGRVQAVGRASGNQLAHERSVYLDKL